MSAKPVHCQFCDNPMICWADTERIFFPLDNKTNSTIWWGNARYQDIECGKCHVINKVENPNNQYFKKEK